MTVIILKMPNKMMMMTKEYLQQATTTTARQLRNEQTIKTKQMNDQDD